MAKQTPHHSLVEAIRDSFGDTPWKPGDGPKKAKIRNAAKHMLSRDKITSGDLRPLIYELWSKGLVELIPPKKPRETYRIRLTEKGQEHSGSNGSIEEAYSAIKNETKSSGVFFSDLAERTGLPLSEIHRWALAKAKDGEAELSEGDFSLAYKDQKDACFQYKGQKFLVVGLVN